MTAEISPESSTSPSIPIEFVFIGESGVLEKQSRLLAESIRQLGGRYSKADITILQPRRDKKISSAGRKHFDALQARVVEMSIISPTPEYGSSYRILACAEHEASSRAERLVFMDSDTVLLAEPDLELQDADVAARPVDVKGMCTTGETDPNDHYWQKLCEVCGVDCRRLPFVETTVGHERVRASYNGGLTVTKKKDGLFAKTAEFYSRSLHAKLLPWPDRKNKFRAGHGQVSIAGARLWGSAQACASLAITALGRRVRILPPSQNFPLHFYPELLTGIKSGAIPTISHVHYHHLFRDEPRDNPVMAGMPGFPAGSIEWLKKHKALFA